ncbi:MAG: hypothetical protein LH649_18260 [Pseudanabaena sp. CAN_BIN31]|nr:hypothetical protein [Pseudanabaena sp. CAN_BIN31]
MGKKNKQSFRKTWRTLTEIGQEFGVSAVKFGKLLKQYSLREEDGAPSQLSKDSEFIQEISPKDGKPYFLWHSEKVSQYLVSQGAEKCGLTAKEASISTEARKIARSYLDAMKLDNEGDKLGYMMFAELVDDIKKIGLDKFNIALKSVGYKGKEITLDGW